MNKLIERLLIEMFWSKKMDDIRQRFFMMAYEQGRYDAEMDGYIPGRRFINSENTL